MTENRALNLEGPSEMFLSFSQFQVYDSTESQPGSSWSGNQSRQGFVRRELAISFATLIEDGSAELKLYLGNQIDLVRYNRIIRVPLRVPSGDLRIDGPVEYPVCRRVIVIPGIYRVTVAQTWIDEENEAIDIFLEETDSLSELSEILVKDSGLNPPDVLIETGEVA